MKKLILLFTVILLVSLISGCKTEGVDTTLYKDGEKAINIINKSFETKQKILTKADSTALQNFFEEYEFPDDESFKNKDEEFAYWVGALEITSRRYIRFSDDYTLSEEQEVIEKYQTVLEKLQKDYKIKLTKE